MPLSPRITAGLLLAVSTAALSPGTGHAAEPVRNDYPTEARVDYVLGCMASNGQGRDVMGKCACSIDIIAGQISYDDYTAVETAMAMQQMPGERAGMMRDVGWIKDLLERFRQAQIEADLECFPHR
ncbi:hypothetical protein [Oleisolibacter albus]|uniref:hypothetical protein n=1 Tax=Oleisolibacter albus TaxID=2171757 RepID=UPI001EFE462C|nr:hypothetical protein [Oleisolibacter albus]